MLVGITENGYLKNVKVTEEGELLVKQSGGGNKGTTINNTEDTPVPVKEIKENVTTLNASILTVGTEASVIEVNKKVTAISIANYSENDDITITVKDKSYQIGASLAIDFPINDTLESITLTSTGTDTKTQLVIEGVE